MTESFSAIDLFGMPVRQGFGQKGRPPYEVTKEKRNVVMLLLAMRRKDEEIAAALGITPRTLRKYFIPELKHRDEARMRVEGKRMALLWAQVEAGSVPAMKELRAILEAADRDAIARTFDGSEAGRHKATGQRRGKKEQALLDALEPDAGTTMGELLALRQGTGPSGKTN